ncbi:NACHT domain-containing protein [Mucilaginibacter pedocola]|uniref:DEP domain-containing protein n=1 Tax=Mucilaginibacter pedocola TaxID=1792845 RepID=A0A1S9PFW8_9SPHI|nr:NACHT domain-containing protein [Mucilaginibacter pedocola]OOQ59840.1 hypothetical protein BC343_06755 [Mucilaginibacter pedocola]
MKTTEKEFKTFLKQYDAIKANVSIKMKRWTAIDDDAFSKLFNYGRHNVLLGNPGAGKSSIVKYAICKILEQDESVFEESDIYRFLPFRIELHRYNEERLKNQLGLAEYLVRVLASEYQTHLTLERMIKILTYFPCLVCFDGLDEIFDVQERIAVRNAIEQFAGTYPDVRLIVTSRYESYEEVSFSDFNELEVRDFNDVRVKAYLEKWYRLEESDKTVRKAEIAGCLQKLEQVDPELKYNPLLLSLIIILYRNELELPANKLLIYKGCTDTLVEHRDEKEKKLQFNLKITNKLAVFAAIAFWQYLQAGVKLNNHVVGNHIRNYLLSNGDFDDHDEAGKAATEFLEYAKLRSIYFENKFTHKTFLEYFTANYIFSQFYMTHDRDKFYDILTKNMGLSSWSVVLELLILQVDSQLTNKNFFTQLVDYQLSENPNEALLFFLPVLKYLSNLNDKTAARVIRLSILAMFLKQFPVKEGWVDHPQQLFNLLTSLYRTERFRTIIQKVCEEMFGAGTLNAEQIGAFAYETGAILGDWSLVDKFHEWHPVQATALQATVRNLHGVTLVDRYMEVLEDMIRVYGIEVVIPIMRSTFGQPVFVGQPKFNWIATIATMLSPEEVKQTYKKFKDMGITQSLLRKACSEPFQDEHQVAPFMHLLRGLPKSGYRDFLDGLLKPYQKTGKNLLEN